MNFKKSLRVKIILFFSLAVLIPLIFVSSLIVTISRNTLWDYIKREQEEIVLRIGDRVNSHIENTKDLLKSSLSGSTRLNKPNQTKEIFSNLLELNKNIIEITSLNRQGKETFKINRAKQPGKYEYGKTFINRSVREEFTAAIRDGSYVSPLSFSDNKIPYIIISCADENKNSVILCKMNLNNVWDIVSNTQIGRNGYVFIVDSKGLLIAHPANERVLAHTDYTGLPSVNAFLAKEKNTYTVYKDENGQNVISFFYTIPGVSWGVFSSLPYDELIEPVNKMVKQALLWLTVFATLFVVIGLKFATTLLTPLNQLRNAATMISEGKYEIELDIESGDEIEDLAKTFGKMAFALKELEIMRQDLISMIVHDMKSPLSGIIGSLDFLLSANMDANEQKEIFSITKRSADTLYELIQNLLDVSKMEDGKLKLKQNPTPIEEVVSKISAPFDFTAKSENKEFIVQIDDTLPEINMDTNLIFRVLNNLLCNSLHHTNENGKIWLKASKKNEKEVQIEVADNGMGIPEEFRTKIFEKFVQIERKRAHLRTGTGLGLTFCKMAIELHGGIIWVESEENKGSRFIFTLPV
ncbi:MAG: hypothetical protein A2252_01750 [Elusimicrobia bacterium RIFOXYA2_FULL_39_19]|nr:MAG: hypothetical protein A2252_01750 [Elusimicrobia bacterium RIFOXYA2_FULL_39_19]